MARLLGIGLVVAASCGSTLAAEADLQWRPARPALAAQNTQPGKIVPAQSYVRQVADNRTDGPALTPVLPASRISTMRASQLPEPTPLSPLGNIPEPSPTLPVPTPEPGRLDSPNGTVPTPDFSLPAPGSLDNPPNVFAPGTPNSPDRVIPPPSVPLGPDGISNLPLPGDPGQERANQRNLTQEDCDLGREELSKSGLDLAKTSKILDLAYRDKGTLPYECTLESTDFTPRSWNCLTYTWKASALCHKPLYFEQAAAERYGHSYGPLVDPFIGAAHFFGTLPILPYKMGVDTPNECQYSLGYYRPGNCAPHMIEPFPISARGAAVQTGFVFGAISALP